MAEFPPHGLVDWDDELFTWLQVAHNDDGTLKASVAVLAPDYLLTTDGTTVFAHDSSGALVDSDTDVGALVTSLAANYKSFLFGTGVFPWTTLMDLDGFFGVSLVGQGGLQDERKASVGGRAATQLKWTPAAGQALSAVGTQGLRLQNIAFQYSNASYVVGDGTEDAIAVFNFDGVDHNTPTRHLFAEHCYFGAVGTGKLDCAGPLLGVNMTVNIGFRSCLFVGGTMHLRSHHTIDADDFANVVEFTACRFSRNKSSAWPSFRGSGESWTFRNCHWEPGQNLTIWVHETVVSSFKGLTYADCWVGDQGSATPPGTGSAYISFNGTGLSILGGRWSCNEGYSILYFNEAAHGIVFSGVDIENINDATNGVINIASARGKEIVLQGLNEYPTTGTLINGTPAEPPRTGYPPYKGLSANTTLKVEEHLRTFGVDASGGARTITLPANTCAGLTLTVKKTDSSGNAVTVTPASGTIDGAGTFSLATQYKFVRVIATGSTWLVVGSN